MSNVTFPKYQLFMNFPYNLFFPQLKHIKENGTKRHEIKK